MTDEPEGRTSSSVPSRKREITRQSQDLVSRGLESLARQEARTIEFPSNYLCGKLYIGDRSTLEEKYIPYPYSAVGDSLRSCEARGRITINAGEEALLYIHPDVPSTGFLRELPSDAIWGIFAGRGYDGSFVLDLSDLAELTELRYLSFHCTSDMNAASLARLGNLRSLTLFAKHPLADQWMEQISQLAELVNLEVIDRGGISDSGVGSLGSLLNLRSLHLGGTNGLSAAGTTFISQLPKLEKLVLSGDFVTDDALSHIVESKSLIYLGVTNSAITDVGLAHLGRLVGLRSLLLSAHSGKSHFTDAGLAYIGDLPGLAELSLRNTGTTDMGVARLAGLVNLESLSLENNPITDGGLVHISSLTNLRSLSLRGTRVTGSGLRHLKNLTDLETLDLDQTLLSGAGLRHLSALTNLQRPSLSEMDDIK